MKWAKVIDGRRCIGCHACTVACKMEHQVPLGVTRTFVKTVEVGVFPSVQRHFQVTRCNQCNDPPCVAACPTSAMYRRPDGIVDFNRDTCIGCKACIAACPYDAIYIDPESNSAEKCNFCTHRIDVGLQPACVVVCPTQAIIVGDLNDPGSEVSQLISTQTSRVRRPEKNTEPKLFYVDGNEDTLDPLAAVSQGSYAWAEEQAPLPLAMKSGVIGDWGKTKNRSPSPDKTAAAAILAYQHPTKSPWDWRVSGYIWTKGVASGAFLLASLGAFFGGPGTSAFGWHVAVTVLSAVFLALTGVLLIADLSHPKRFYTILLRPQWRSWLARGAFIIAAFAALLGVVLIATLLELEGFLQGLQGVGIALAALTGVYTAFLLGQSKGRDLWQNPLLPASFLAHIGVAGAASLLLLGPFFDLSDGDVAWFRWALTVSLGAYLLLAVSELAMRHPSREAAQASRNMLWGSWAPFFWAGLVLPLSALLVAVLSEDLVPGLVVAGVLAAAGLLSYEHAYIQAGQSVPLS